MDGVPGGKTAAPNNKPATGRQQEFCHHKSSDVSSVNIPPLLNFTKKKKKKTSRSERTTLGLNDTDGPSGHVDVVFCHEILEFLGPIIVTQGVK